jgi:hypothetical protein
LAPHLGFALALGIAASLSGCGSRHEFQRLPSGDGALVATVDYEKAEFGLTRDAIVSVQEKRGIASLVATFHNVQSIDVTWLGPQDLNICQMGAVIGYKTSVPLNTSIGIRTVHVHYDC